MPGMTVMRMLGNLVQYEQTVLLKSKETMLMLLLIQCVVTTFTIIDADRDSTGNIQAMSGQRRVLHKRSDKLTSEAVFVVLDFRQTLKY